MEITLINTTTHIELKFDDVTFLATSLLEENTTVTHSTEKTIKKIGENITNSSVSSRLMNLTGVIMGDTATALKQAKSKLLNLINPLQEIIIQVDNMYQISTKPSCNVRWGKNWSSNNDSFCKFSLEFLAASTLWTDIEPTTVSFTEFCNNWTFPFALSDNFTFGTDALSKEISISNENNVDTGIVITLTTTAQVINPVLVNTISHQKMQLNATLEPGDILVITSNYSSKAITLNGNNAIKIFDFLESDWLMLNPGLNTFTYSTQNGAESNLNIEIEYYNTYWGVV